MHNSSGQQAGAEYAGIVFYMTQYVLAVLCAACFGPFVALNGVRNLDDLFNPMAIIIIVFWGGPSAIFVILVDMFYKSKHGQTVVQKTVSVFIFSFIGAIVGCILAWAWSPQNRLADNLVNFAKVGGFVALIFALIRPRYRIFSNA